MDAHVLFFQNNAFLENSTTWYPQSNRYRFLCIYFNITFQFFLFSILVLLYANLFLFFFAYFHPHSQRFSFSQITKYPDVSLFIYWPFPNVSFAIIALSTILIAPISSWNILPVIHPSWQQCLYWQQLVFQYNNRYISI